MAVDYYEIAKKNYPDNWNIEMLRKFVQRGRITAEQFAEITGEKYDG